MPCYGIWFKGRRSPYIVNAGNRNKAMTIAKKSGTPCCKKSVIKIVRLNADQAKKYRSKKSLSLFPLNF